MLKNIFPFNRLVRRFQGIDKKFENLQRKLSRIEKSLEETQRSFDYYTQDPSSFWLHKNKEERMDANVSIFQDERRLFHLARYELAATYAEGMNVLDIACGTGYGSDLLFKKGRANTVIGVDIDSEAVAYARLKYGSENVSFIAASGDKTKLQGNHFDLLASFETIEHVVDEQPLLAEFARLLRPGGILICSTPNAWPVDLSEHHYREYNRDSFVEALDKYFKVEELYNQNSGGNSFYNHDQPAGIIPTTDENHELAECLIAICAKLDS